MMGFPGGSAGKESASNAGNLGSNPLLGRSPGEGNGYPLWYSGLENSTDCTVHGVAKNRTQLITFYFPDLIPCTHSDQLAEATLVLPPAPALLFSSLSSSVMPLVHSQLLTRKSKWPFLTSLSFHASTLISH